MKKIKLIFISLAIITAIVNSYSQNTNKCLELVYPHEPKNGLLNPDSVMVDTCSESPTFGKWYSKKGFEFGMSIYVFGNDTLSMEDAVTWEDISSSFTQIKKGFQNLELEFGPYVFKRSNWNPNDSSFFNDPVFLLEFQDYFEFDSVSNALGDIDSTSKAWIKNIPGILYDVESSNNYLEDLFSVEFNDNFLCIYLNYKDILSKSNINNIKIYNLNGYEILNIPINNKNEIYIDISHFAHGIYIIKVNNQIKLINM